MKLTTKRRNGLAASMFGLPKDREYPMPDRGHAIIAKSDASKEYNRGKLTKAQRDEIDRKANRILGRRK